MRHGTRHIFILLLAVIAACTRETPSSPPAPVPPAGFTPPAEHPRLFLRASDIPELKAKVQTAEGKKIISKLESLSTPRSAAEEAAVTDHGYRYYYEMRGVTSKAQLQALDYLLNKEKNSARSAITSMLDTLRRTKFGTSQDLSRASGVMLMVGAVVYDWCYDCLSSDEKAAFIREFKRIAGTMECKYPPRGTQYIAGHPSEWMILRDMLSAGIAIYDEDPEMYNHVAALLKDKYIPARNYFYSGGNYHQGTNYITVRFGNDLISMWIMSRMGLGNIYSPKIRDVAYDLVYRRRPDGQVLPAGDTNPLRRGNYKNYSMIGFLAGSYFHDPYLEYEYDAKPETENHMLLMELLWRDFDLKGKKADDTLPKVRYSGSPYGWMTARTGWDASSVIAEMKVNEQYVGNHQHLDAGSFQIYYKGPLAIDSGTYQGSSGDYSSPHCINYFKRTIAHNSILVYKDFDTFACSGYGNGKTLDGVNDGGQRMPDYWTTCQSMEDLKSDEYTTGKALYHHSDDDFAVLKGDITKAYSDKVSDVRRTFVLVDHHSPTIPATFIVSDHVVSTSENYRKYFLLHCIEEPELLDDGFNVRRTLNGDRGMLHCTTLLPQKAQISKVGGKGKEFWVFGQNFPNDMNDEANERGSWRVEICPEVARKTDQFLNVMQIADNGCTSFKDVELIDEDGITGASTSSFTVLFASDAKLLEGEHSLTVPSCARGQKVLICDLTPGNWNITAADGSSVKMTVGDSCCARIESAPKSIILTQLK